MAIVFFLSSKILSSLMCTFGCFCPCRLLYQTKLSACSPSHGGYQNVCSRRVNRNPFLRSLCHFWRSSRISSAKWTSDIFESVQKWLYYRFPGTLASCRVPEEVATVSRKVCREEPHSSKHWVWPPRLFSMLAWVGLLLLCNFSERRLLDSRKLHWSQLSIFSA